MLYSRLAVFVHVSRLGIMHERRSCWENREVANLCMSVLGHSQQNPVTPCATDQKR